MYTTKLLLNIYLIILNLDLTIAEKADSFGEDLPFGFLHNAALEGLGCVVLFYFNSTLEHDGSRVTFGDDDMDRRARNPDALFERGFVNVKTVKTLSAEGWDERGMDV